MLRLRDPGKIELYLVRLRWKGIFFLIFKIIKCFFSYANCSTSVSWWVGVSCFTSLVIVDFLFYLLLLFNFGFICCFCFFLVLSVVIVDFLFYLFGYCWFLVLSVVIVDFLYYLLLLFIFGFTCCYCLFLVLSALSLLSF